MITKMFKRLMASSIASINANVCYIPAKTTSNTQVYLRTGGNTGWPYDGQFSTFTLSNSSGIMVGSGVTPPTENDYMLETQITSGLSGSITYTRTYDAETEKSQLRILLALVNTSNAPITVGEIGYVGSVRGGNKDSVSNNNYNILFDRTVFDSPITIPAEAAATITYTLEGAA